MNFEIGPRMIKTGVSVTITLLITSYLSIELGFVAVLASVLAMQPSVIRSYKYIKEIVLANSIGIALAILAVLTLGNHSIVIGATVVASIVINIKLKLHKTINLTIVTIVILMMSDGTGLNFAFIASRLSLIGIGVTVSLVVNTILFPPNHKKNLFNMMKDTSKKAIFLLRVIPSKAMSVPMIGDEKESFEKDLSSVKDYYRLMSGERKSVFVRNKYGYLRTLVIYRQMIKVLERQQSLIRNTSKNLRKVEKFSDEKTIIIKSLLNDLNDYSESIFMMYEGKVVLDKELQKESKKSMRLTVNTLVEESRGASLDKWQVVLPIANSIVGLFLATEKLESYVRADIKRANRSKRK